MNKPLRNAIPGLAFGAAALFAGLAQGLTPPPVRSVADWAQEKRQVSADSGSPHAGEWDNALVPYAVEPMECMSFDHPCRSITWMKSAQVGGSEAGINFFGYVVDEQPAPMLIVLPTLDELRKYNRLKLQPTIDATPALKAKVRANKSRDEDGSTTLLKRFRGGFCQLAGANSSAGLQMISVRVLICEEVTEYPPDVDDRGDPLELAEKRTTAWSATCKKAYISTPGIAGACRITVKYQASDQRRFYVRCPHCGDAQTLKPSQLKRRSETKPYGAYFECLSNGCVIEHFDKKAMVAAGVWIKTFEDSAGRRPPEVMPDAEVESWRSRGSEGREPGFHIWQAYSPFVSWDDTVDEKKGAEGNPQKEKIYVQQVEGEAFVEDGVAPDHEELYKRRLTYAKGAIPPGGLVLTGFADIQHNRIEWAVYAWGIGLTGWIVDHGVIEGDPEQEPSTWTRLNEVVARTYPDCRGNHWPIEAFGVDTGFLTTHVYQFCRHRERLFATDGRAGALLPMLGAPKVMDFDWLGKTVKGGVKLWPLGTHPLKADIYARLRKTIAGPDADGLMRPGALFFYEACDQEFFKQITAEYLDEVTKKDGRIVREWVRPRTQANEQLDIVVGARALAWKLGLDNLDERGWMALAAQRGAEPEDVQRDLAALWSKPPSAVVVSEPAPAAVERVAVERVAVERGSMLRPRGG